MNTYEVELCRYEHCSETLVKERFEADRYAIHGSGCVTFFRNGEPYASLSDVHSVRTVEAKIEQKG